MRPLHAVVLARMLLVFFSRKVLRMGVLRSRGARLIAAAGVLTLMTMSIVVGYLFLKPMVSDERAWSLLFEMSTVSAVLWVQIAFLLVKTLFLNAEGMLELSFQLPLTNRERAAAFMLYEASMAGIVAATGFVSLSTASFLLLGPAAVPRIAEAIVFPVVLTYLVLNVGYQLAGRVLLLLGIRRIKNVLLILLTFAGLLAYASHASTLTTRVTTAYLTGGDPLVWVSALSWLSRHNGWAVMAGAFALLAATLALLALWLMPSQHVGQSRYLNVPLGRAVRLLGPYDLSLIRSAQTWVGASIAATVFVYLSIEPVTNPMWGLAVLSLGGLYQFAATGPLRTVVVGRTGPWTIYARLVKAQLIVLASFTLPALLALLLIDVRLVAQSPPVLLGCLAGVLLSICIGVLFPAENDNPFSVFIGLSVTGAALGLVGVGLGVLQLPPVAVTAFVVCALAMFVWYAVHGIRTAESRRRHEEVAHTGQQRRRRGPADPGGSSVHPALSHVLDG